MIRFNGDVFRIRLAKETDEQLKERIALWSRMKTSTDLSSSIKDVVLSLTKKEIANRAELMVISGAAEVVQFYYKDHVPGAGFVIGPTVASENSDEFSMTAMNQAAKGEEKQERIREMAPVLLEALKAAEWSIAHGESQFSSDRGKQVYEKVCNAISMAEGLKA